MAKERTIPELGEVLKAMGEAGARLSEIDASEGAAGNISVCLAGRVDPGRQFPRSQQIDLPGVYPVLAGRSLLVTGSGRRLREIRHDPAAHIGFLQVEDGGKRGTLYTATNCRFRGLTGELNSHLAAHADQIEQTGANFQALIHAQPPNLTFLSQIPAYRDNHYLSRHLLRWQPEMIMQFPRGIGCVPFFVPGSEALEAATRVALREYRVVLWAKHGVIARSARSVRHALDLIEYVEAGARYEYMNLKSGQMAEGLTQEEMLQICAALGIETSLFGRESGS